MQIDRRPIEMRIAGDDAQDFTVARTVGRSDADGKYGWPAVPSRPLRPSCPSRPGRVPAIRQHDDARDALPAITLANRGERASQIRTPRVGADLVERTRRCRRE